MNYVEMKVSGVIFDPSSLAPMVVLKDLSERESLPIWIGVMEAAAILSELEGVKIDRPMTHDLLNNIINSAGSEIQKITVDDLKDSVFYATIFLKLASGDVIEVDSRPSDAIAVAVRSRSAILVSEKVMSQAKMIDLTKESLKGLNSKSLSAILKNMPDEEFGKYKM